MEKMVFALVSLCLVLVVGCTTGEAISEIQIGMSESEVRNILGVPDGVSEKDGVRILKYIDRLVSGWSWNRGDYYVVLEKGKVVDYGASEVRHNNVGVPFGIVWNI